MPYMQVSPVDWPQDAMRVPSGLGSMPPIEFGNRHVTQSEYFALSARFQVPAATQRFTTFSTVLATPQDGDFWCDQIAAVSWQNTVGVQGFDVLLGSMVTIIDARTQKSLIYSPSIQAPLNQGVVLPPNSVPLVLFRKFPGTGGPEGDLAYSGNNPTPAGFRDTGTLIQPHCFTRQGGIAVSLTTNYTSPGNVSYDITLMFSGWKEYANASR